MELVKQGLLYILEDRLLVIKAKHAELRFGGASYSAQRKQGIVFKHQIKAIEELIHDIKLKL